VLTVALVLHRQCPRPYPCGGQRNRGHTEPHEPELNRVQAQRVQIVADLGGAWPVAALFESMTRTQALCAPAAHHPLRLEQAGR
jgi:hypothetical protein